MNTEEMASLYGTPIWRRLRMHRNPVRMLFSGGVWASAWYLFSSVVVGLALFCIVTSITITSTALVIIWAGLPLLIGTGYFIRGCVVLERGRARAVVPEGLPALPPVETAEGFFPTLKAIWRDRITKRGLAHFTLLALPLFLLDMVVWVVWVAFLAGVTVPIWYRYIPRGFNGQHWHGLEYGYFPNGPHGKDSIGFWIGSDLSATVAAVAALVLLLAWNYVLVATARLHTDAVRNVVAPRDPLASARRVLETPGPLNTATHT
ncbi:sensor domain-containing protein [Catenulispora pinisilvae]|uniref:sensor domain-containing protein n=1 Tax=Catenulispora pinisilvae TaxID=2705253 RepID=UPI0018913D57|nr:sensor domain-containing protein [Catenulispora pinisilvae]